MPVRDYIELKARCEQQMHLSVCNGCDSCGLRCASGVPATEAEWESLQRFLTACSPAERAEIAKVEAQDKSVDLGDGVAVTMCRYRDMAAGRCVVYPVRPLVCRLLGHVEWMPCPIEKVPQPIPTPDALALLQAYACFDRKTFEEWKAADNDRNSFPGPSLASAAIETSLVTQNR